MVLIMSLTCRVGDASIGVASRGGDGDSDRDRNRGARLAEHRQSKRRISMDGLTPISSFGRSVCVALAGAAVDQVGDGVDAAAQTHGVGVCAGAGMVQGGAGGVEVAGFGVAFGE